jgi:hypothetical protein
MKIHACYGSQNVDCHVQKTLPPVLLLIHMNLAYTLQYHCQGLYLVVIWRDEYYLEAGPFKDSKNAFMEKFQATRFQPR